MAQSAFGLPSLYDPSIAVEQAQLERQMALAQALRQQALSPVDISNRQIGGMGYRVSPMEGIAKVVQAIAANKMYSDTDQQRADLGQRSLMALASMLKGDGPLGNLGGQQAPVSDPNGGRPPGVTADAMTAGGFPQPPAQPAPTPQTAPQPTAPSPQGFSLANLLRGNAIESLGGNAMGSAYAKNFETPEAVRTLTAEGQNPQEVGNLTTQKLRREATQPTALGRWGYVDANNVIHGAPATLPGFIATPDPNSPGGFSYVQPTGGADAIRAAAAAEAKGKASAVPYDKGVDKFGNPLPVRSVADVLDGSSQPGPNPTSPSLDSIPPAVQASRDATRRQILEAEFAKTTNPTDRALIQKELNGTKNGQAYPTTSSTSSAPTAPGAVYGAPPLGTENAQKGLDTSWEALKAQNREAQNTSSYLDNIVQAAHKGAIVGPGADRREMIQGVLQLAGIKQAVNENAVDQTTLLDKYHNQIISRLGQGGLGTDQARALLDAAYPGKQMNVGAIDEAAANLKGAQAMTKAKTTFLLQPATKRDTATYQQREIQFDQNADPRIWQWASIQDPNARKAFLAQTLQSDPSFLDRVKTLKSIGALQ